MAEAPEEELVFLHSRVTLIPASTGWSRPTRITKVSETRFRFEAGRDSRFCSGIRGCGTTPASRFALTVEADVGRVAPPTPSRLVPVGAAVRPLGRMEEAVKHAGKGPPPRWFWSSLSHSRTGTGPGWGQRTAVSSA